MLKYYICLYFLLYLIQTFGQSTLIAKHGFESTGDSWAIGELSTPPCTQEDDSWNTHSSLGDIVPSEGLLFWGIHDLNGNCGSSGFEFIEFTALNIAAYRNVLLSFEVQVKGYDNGDDMKYQLWFDGLPQPEEYFIEGANDLSTGSWTTVKVAIPNAVSSVTLRISVKQNGDDLAGLDNIQLTGVPISYCSGLLISEYLEGSSSSTHRNNYIELYNAGDASLDLSEYKLLKYTGSNLQPSATLQLYGIMEPYATFLIEDDQESLQIKADLSTNSSVMNFNGDDKIALMKDVEIIDLIGVIGDSINFGKDITLRRRSNVKTGNDQYTIDEWDIYGLEDTGGLNSHTSYCQGNFPEIEVSGLGLSIPDGSNTTSIRNNTYFGAWPIAKDTLIQRSFTIKNSGNDQLELEQIQFTGEHAVQFSHNLQTPLIIAPGDSLQFEVSYLPNEAIIHNANLKITNNDPSENPFQFLLQGEGTSTKNHPLLISQYYEGEANNKWIEVTNISSQPSPENTYFLALFWNEDVYHPIGIKPSRKVLIPSIDPGHSLLYSATLKVTAPLYALDEQVIKTSVCGFTGDDMIIISTSMDESCWADRVDMIGQKGNWGSNLSMVRKYGCLAFGPNTGFDIAEWLVYSNEEIDSALSGTNQRIGIHYSGPTSWKHGVWTNGKPDINRKAFIDSDYETGIHGNLETCALHIREGAALSVGAKDFLLVKSDLFVEGKLDILHEGSLVMLEDTGVVDNQGMINIHKKASDLKPYDYTYWSSPTTGTRLEEVFWDSPQNSFYSFSTQNFLDTDLDGLDDNNDAWVATSGAMKVGRGYTSMAPDSTPFQNSQDVTFSGTIHNGQLTTPLMVQKRSLPQQHHWNLVGNPYPSAIDAEKLLSHPANTNMLTGTLYFWTHHTAAVTDGSLGDQSYLADDYAIYTLGTGGIRASESGKEPTKYISSCQGFFVEALQEGNLTFTNSMRTVVGNDNFFKSTQIKNPEGDQSNKIWLNLSNDKGAFSQLLIGFINGATPEFDPNYDGQRLNSGNFVSFYSMMNKYQLAIQGLPPFSGDEIIKLGMKSSVEHEISLDISIDHVSGILNEADIFLHDKLLNKVQNLKLAPYSIELSKNQHWNDRFELRFKDTGAVDPESTQKPSKLIWNLFDNLLTVSTDQKESILRLEIFDLNGRKLRDLEVGTPLAQTYWSGFPKRAIYVLRAKLEDSRTIVTKIIP